MKKPALRLAVAAAVAGLVATLAPLSAFAASTPTYDTTTDAPIYLLDGTTATEIASGTQLDWNYANTIVLTANPAPADLGDLAWARFPNAKGAVSSIAFLAAQGSERTPTAWKQWTGFGGSTTDGVLLPSVWPGYLGQGAPAATKAAGGTYSMGIALTDGEVLSNMHVVKAFYTTINVDAGTGTWTFARPTGAPITVATTTNLSTDRSSITVGGSLKLTAAVSPSGAAGSVQFREGTTSLGNSTVSAGTATLTVVVSSLGRHSYTATFTPNTSGYGASTSSAVTVTTVAKKFTKTNKPTISGTAKVGKKLTAKVKAWSPVAKFTYKWYANGAAIKGATKSTWKLAKSQKGKKITVKVTGSRADYASLSLVSKATAKVKK